MIVVLSTGVSVADDGVRANNPAPQSPRGKDVGNEVCSHRITLRTSPAVFGDPKPLKFTVCCRSKDNVE
ncbi:hypothetical protein D3C85_1013020 [compost metagenome]